MKNKDNTIMQERLATQLAETSSELYKQIEANNWLCEEIQSLRDRLKQNEDTKIKSYIQKTYKIDVELRKDKRRLEQLNDLARADGCHILYDEKRRGYLFHKDDENSFYETICFRDAIDQDMESTL